MMLEHALEDGLYKLQPTEETEEASVIGLTELVLFPHEGHIFLDTLPSGRQCITHDLTMERFELPVSASGFELEFGESFATCCDDTNFVLLEERLTKQLLVGKNGVMFVKHKQLDDTIKKYSLTDRYQEYSFRNAFLENSMGGRVHSPGLLHANASGHFAPCLEPFQDLRAPWPQGREQHSKQVGVQSDASVDQATLRAERQGLACQGQHSFVTRGVNEKLGPRAEHTSRWHAGFAPLH